MNVKSICLKNNPCLSKSNNDKLETNDVSITDSFDVLMNQANSDDLKDKLEDSFEELKYVTD